MRRVAAVILSILLFAGTVVAKHNVPKQGVDTGIDLISANEYCHSTGLDEIEGIWEYAEEGFCCLIQRQPDNVYRMVALESRDAALLPGVVMGYIYPTPSPKQYDMYLYSSIKQGLPCSPKECLATLSTDGEGLELSSKKYRISPNPVVLLPWMWRLINIRIDNPVDKMPRGLQKIAPGYDGDGSSARRPRYL